MLSSSPTSFAPSFLFSPPLSPSSPPFRSSFSPPLATDTATAASCSHTFVEEPRRVSASASLYEILEVPVSATSQEIKAAYRRLARICHPDVAGIGRNSSSAEEFMKIHTAYCTLSDPEKRAVYDRRILRRRRPLTTGIYGFGRSWGTNWETDQCW